MGRRAIDEWLRLDPALLRPTGILETGSGVELHAEALERCGEPFEWLEPGEAQTRFPEARFEEPVLWTEGGIVLADEALAALRKGIDVREGVRIDDPSSIEADVVVACPGGWLARLYDLPVYAQIEQVHYFPGVPDDRPALVDHGPADGNLWYGLATPGVGWKVAKDSARPGPFDASSPERPLLPELTEEVRRKVMEWLPGIEPRVVHQEACLYAMSPDGDFILDEIDGVVVCGGDSGHAFKFGPLLGRYIADLAQGRTLPPECDRFRADRFAGATA